MLPSRRSTPKSPMTRLSTKIWSGGLLSKLLSRSLSTFQKVSPPTAPSPTLLRSSALKGSPRYLYRVRSPTFSPKPRKSKLNLVALTRSKGLCVLLLPGTDKLSLHLFIFSVLSVLFGMVCLVSGLLPLTFPN